jgi:AraC-like DNA-binding protein
MSKIVENQPKRGLLADPERLAALPRAVVAWQASYRPGEALPAHRHRRAQLVYAAEGMMRVTTPDGSWLVPPQRAVWVPPGTDHSIRMSSAVSMRTLYIDGEKARRMPSRCCVLSVSPLLRELILRAMELPTLYEIEGPQGRLMRVILDEIRTLPSLPLHLPTPGERRLVQLCRALLRDPGDRRGIEEWGRDIGASGRTLARLFRRETGMSFGAWRQQARLIEALARLGAGEPVTHVALDLGYESPSAFTAMFRRALGVTPSRYFDAPPSRVEGRARTRISPPA